MPELPEVETIRAQMENEIIGEVVGEVKVQQPKVFLGESKDLKGKKISKLSRQGKYLFVYFEDKSGIQIHLKMTGRLVVNDEWYETAKHTRVIITLESGRKLYYWDTRMFGYLKPTSNIEAAEEKVKSKLGKDPWQITVNELKRKLEKTGRAIKDVLLDQNIIAGIGNIYANDALWKAGIDPRRKGKEVTLTECKKIIKAVQEVMERSLQIGGASDNTFRDFYGKTGGYQNEFLVYGKTKGQCAKCGRDLIYFKISGRGTWRCDHCQK